MTTERWQDVVALFEQALEMDPAQWTAFVRRAAGADTGLGDRVLAMLRMDSEASPLLDARPGTLADAVSDPLPSFEGRRIGAYRMIREIGRGGMGTVWLAEREDIDKRVALKLVAGWLGSPERTARFLFERRVLARLEHPKIARLLDAGVAVDGTPWLAMEYVDGRPITAHCEEKRLGVRDRLALFLTVCDAVAYAHRNLIVHRDLKPSNILVRADGDLRLVDFGIAKLIAAGETGTGSLTRVGSRPMTPDYAAPEQIRGDPITTASDVYQLGILLYELLGGRRPRDFAGRPPHEIVRSLENDAVPAPSRVAAPERRRSLEGDLDNIVAKAMHAEPDGRYASARELGDDVRRHLAGLPVLARPGTVRYRAAKFVRRHRTGTAMALAVTGVVILAAAVLAAQARRVAVQRNRAEQVSSILTDLFASADPTVTRGDTITVRSVLDRGAERVRSDLTADPGVRARVLNVIALAYHSLGEQDRALGIVADVIATLRGTVAPGDRSLIEALREEAVWLAEAGRAAEAIPLLDEAIAAVPDRPERRFERARLLHARAFAFQVTGDAARARPLYEEAARTLRQAPDSLSTWLEATLLNLGYLASSAGDLAGADSLFREVVERRRQRSGSEDAGTATAMTSLADVALDRGDIDEAEQLAISAVTTLRRIYPGPNPRLAEALARRAAVFAARGQNARAEATQREALSIFRAVYPGEHRSIARATADLAGMLRAQDRSDEATDLFREAIAAYRHLLGDRDVTTALTMTNLANAEYGRGRVDESVRLYRAAVPVLDSAWAGSGRIAQILLDFGIALNDHGECDEGEPLLRRALDSERRAWPAGDLRVLRAERALATCLINLRRFAEAEPLLLEVHRRLQASEGENGQWTASTARDLVALYQLWGRPEDAERFRARR